MAGGAADSLDASAIVVVIVAVVVVESGSVFVVVVVVVAVLVVGGIVVVDVAVVVVVVVVEDVEVSLGDCVDSSAIEPLVTADCAPCGCSNRMGSLLATTLAAVLTSLCANVAGLSLDDDGGGCVGVALASLIARCGGAGSAELVETIVVDIACAVCAEGIVVDEEMSLVLSGAALLDVAIGVALKLGLCGVSNSWLGRAMALGGALLGCQPDAEPLAPPVRARATSIGSLDTGASPFPAPVPMREMSRGAVDGNIDDWRQ